MKVLNKFIEFLVKLYSHFYDFKLRHKKVKTRAELSAIAENSVSVISDYEAKAITCLLKSRKILVSDLMTKITAIPHLKSKEKLTPGLVDELYKTNSPIAIVTKKGEEIGIIYLLEAGSIHHQTESVSDIVRHFPETISADVPLLDSLKLFAEFGGILLVANNSGDILGVLELKNVLGKLSLI